MILFPLFGVAAVVIGSLVFDAETVPKCYRFLLVLVLVVTSFSAFLTSAKFSAGDRMLLCWLFVGTGYLLSAIRHGVRLYAYLDSSVALPPAVSNTMVILQNACIALALLLFVLAWRATGLTAPLSKSAQLLSIVAGIAVAVLAGGYPLMKALTTATPNPVLLVSTVGDIIGLSLIVPLALPALALRGGLLMHTWIYLAASEVAWLIYDVWWAVQPDNSVALEACRLAAVLFAFIATKAQRRAMRA